MDRKDLTREEVASVMILVFIGYSSNLSQAVLVLCVYPLHHNALFFLKVLCFSKSRETDFKSFHGAFS